MTRAIQRFLAVATCGALAACEPGAKETVQVGYRGVAEELNYDHDNLAALRAANVVPAPLPPAGPAPDAQYQNVQVLTDVSTTEMTRTMVAMSEWVTGDQRNCNYCHVGSNFATDSLYTKVVARQMLAMVRRINVDWRAHVKSTGVTCYTCHRGQPVPNNVWFLTDENQYLRYYLDRSDARVQSYTALPTANNRSSIKQTENTYALMMGMSRALGTNCSFCHNSRSWATWQNAPPYRINALYGARMVRDLNTTTMLPLTSVFPASRHGPLGDVGKIQCATCHQGVYKPLFGEAMVKDYPGLWAAPGPWPTRVASDTILNGVIDLRGRDSIPTDASPILPPLIPRSRPAVLRPASSAPVRTGSLNRGSAGDSVTARKPS